MITIAAVASVGYVLAGVWIYVRQRKHLFRPRAVVEATPADVGLEYADVRLVNRLGTKLHGWWIPCAGSRRTVLFCHGNGGNVGHRLGTLRLLHDLGLSVLIFDYSGYGQSEGAPSELATQADARSAWDWLMRERGAQPGEVVLFGRSLGGAVAAGLAAELVAEGIRPGGIILESTFTSVPDMAKLRYPWLPVGRLVRDRYETTQKLAGLGIPALFAHSPEDDVVPFALGQALYEGYDGPKAFLPMRGGHNLGWLEMGEPYAEGVDHYLQTL